MISLTNFTLRNLIKILNKGRKGGRNEERKERRAHKNHRWGQSFTSGVEDSRKSTLYLRRNKVLAIQIKKNTAK